MPRLASTNYTLHLDFLLSRRLWRGHYTKGFQGENVNHSPWVAQCEFTSHERNQTGSKNKGKIHILDNFLLQSSSICFANEQLLVSL